MRKSRLGIVTVAITLGLFIAAGCGGGSKGDEDADSSVDVPGDGDTGVDLADGEDVATDDAQDASIDDGAEVEGDAGEDEVPAGTLAVSVDTVTSSAVTLSWDAVAGASEIRLYLGPEPPDAPGGDLPLRVMVATLAGTATAYTMEGVAASTDAFVQVVAAGAPGGDLSGAAHARTEGGPRAALATPLREVHAYGPDVLMLVVENLECEYDGVASLIGNTGPDWQAGTWTVERADGSPVAVTAVHRHSIPVAQPDYPVGFGVYGDDDILDVDHRIFLVLGESIGQREILDVVHTGTAATTLEVLVPFSDRYLETPLIQVNQVGYSPRASRRWAYVSGWMGDGGSVLLAGLTASAEVLAEPADPLDARAPVLAAIPITERAALDPDTGGLVMQIDLAALPAAEGVAYRVRVPGVGVSWRTAVSAAAVDEAFRTVWRGLYHNRWCGDLDAAFTPWSRPPDHCSAYFVETGTTDPWAFFDSATPLEDPGPVVGGHHDAGDFDIRQFHVVVAQYLMRAYEMDPAGFTDGEMDVPESGNGIPDVLDEALWSVAAWEQLQNVDGSVRSGVESWRHPAGYYLASDDELAYWTYDPLAWHTAYVAGLMAQAARLVGPFDAGRSARLETGARSAYAWADVAGAPVEYLLYGASELCRLTGEAGYCLDFEAYWDGIDDWGRGAFDNVAPMADIYPGAFTSYTPAMADFVMGYLDAAAPDAGIVSTALYNLDERARWMTDAVLDSAWAHRNGREAGAVPDWGQATGTGRYGDMIYQRLQLGGLAPGVEQDYVDALSLLADYVFGCNPASYTYVTGLGSRSPQQPLHVDSLAFIQSSGMPPVPGIPVYGPVDHFPGAYWYEPIGAAFYPDFDDQPVGLHLSDTRGSVNMSEFTVWELQAPMAELLAALR